MVETKQLQASAMSETEAAVEAVARAAPPIVVLAVFAVGLLQSLWLILKKPFTKTCVFSSRRTLLASTCSHQRSIGSEMMHSAVTQAGWRLVHAFCSCQRLHARCEGHPLLRQPPHCWVSLCQV